MRFHMATLAALVLSPFVIAAPLDSVLVERDGIWSYNDLYQHAVERGGADDLIAAAIARHVNKTGYSWDKGYEDDIKFGNATLIVHNSFVKRGIIPGAQ